MNLGSVEHRLHVLALTAGEPHGVDGGGGVIGQPSGEVGVGPGPGHDRCPVSGPDLMLVGVDDDVDGSRIDQPLVGQDGLDGPDPGLDRLEVIVVFMIVIVLVTHKTTVVDSGSADRAPSGGLHRSRGHQLTTSRRTP